MEVVNNFELAVDELLESKEYEQTNQAVSDLVDSIYCLCDLEEFDEYPVTDIVKGVKDFLTMIPKHNMKRSMDHLLIFQLYGGPNALVELFTSPIKGNKEIAEESIKLFLVDSKSKSGFLPKPVQNQCALIVLKLCNLLPKYTAASDDDQPCLLYNSCRETLVSILKSIAFANRSKYFGFTKPSFLIELIFPIFHELWNKLMSSLSTMPKCSRSNLAREVRGFAIFSQHLRREIEEHVRSKGQSLPLCLDDDFEKHPCYLFRIERFYYSCDLLRSRLRGCLADLVLCIFVDGRRLQKFNPMWSYYLSLLKELKKLSKLYQGAEDTLSALLEGYWSVIEYIIICSNWSDENQWIFESMKALDFESRKGSLMKLTFPEVKYDEQKPPYKILIGRSQLLTESYELLALANSKLLRNGLSVMFKHEESTGAGVFREWLLLVCQDLFNPQNSLFLACPSDRRRFFPNPAKTDPERLNYFHFCGRLIALALMHKIQVGITFDRVFFLQLAGNEISLEDVRYADPCMYKSCKDILGMDAEFVDSDAMGLTFVNEIEESGCRKVVELCPGGNTTVVSSKNREEYVNLLIQHCFVKSISAKVAYFAQGFADILCKRNLHKYFFQSLDLKDLDRLLIGYDKAICVKEWKAYTDYNDYKETDDQICWFWKVVEGMSSEQQRELLFFWISVKYLPVNGFSGLPGRLSII